MFLVRPLDIRIANHRALSGCFHWKPFRCHSYKVLKLAAEQSFKNKLWKQIILLFTLLFVLKEGLNRKCECLDRISLHKIYRLRATEYRLLKNVYSLMVVGHASSRTQSHLYHRAFQITERLQRFLLWRILLEGFSLGSFLPESF